MQLKRFVSTSALGVAISPDGTRLCVADTGNNRLDLVDIVADHNTLLTPWR
jgi:hypothetical protein